MRSEKFGDEWYVRRGEAFIVPGPGWHPPPPNRRYLVFRPVQNFNFRIPEDGEVFCS